MADNVAITAGSGTNIATDERSIASTTVHVQRVMETGGSAIANGHTQISSTAASIAAARETRKRIIIVNRQTVPIYVGVATVTASNGVLLNPGDVVTLFTTAAVQGITAAAYTASGEDTKVHYVEEYD